MQDIPERDIRQGSNIVIRIPTANIRVTAHEPHLAALVPVDALDLDRVGIHDVQRRLPPVQVRSGAVKRRRIRLGLLGLEQPDLRPRDAVEQVLDLVVILAVLGLEARATLVEGESLAKDVDGRDAGGKGEF